MLNAKNRLKKRKEFAYIYKKGNKVHGRGISVFFVASRFPTPRVGFSVSNKIGKAITRNRIKRQLRHIMRDFIPSIHNCNIVLLAHPEIIDMDYATMHATIQKLLTKGNLINA